MRLAGVSLLAGVVAEEYCPTKDDLTIAYCDNGNKYHNIMDCPQLNDGGWYVEGGGGVATKSSFNLNGGYVEYDIDFTNVDNGVNANIYTISPERFQNGAFFDKVNDYCDGAATGSDWCIEMDWIETNGNCGGASTIHTIEGPGSDGCTGWGCRNSYHYGGTAKIAMRVDYDQNGQWTISMNGNPLGQFDPVPDNRAWDIVRRFHEERGAVIYSSQWTGWVPLSDCGGSYDLYGSTFTVSNLKISGSVVQGPEPSKCSAGPSPDPSPAPAPAPAPAPPPAPAPAPTGGQCCWGGCGHDCHADQYCSANEGQCTSNCGGIWCFSGEVSV